MRSRVAIVGAGQLGSRYLQGLAQATTPLDIWVVDPSTASLDTAMARWRDVSSQESVHRVQPLNEMGGLPPDLDVAVLAMSADARAGTFAEITSSLNPRFAILEKILSQGPAQLEAIRAAASSLEGVWVNHPRRLMAWHKAIRDALSGEGPLSVSLKGASWGLATSALHFVDLVMWWTGELPEAVDTQGISGMWSASKRPGFVEVDGTLVFRYNEGSLLELTSLRDPTEVPTVLKVDTPDATWIIDEMSGRAGSADGAQHIAGSMNLQSELTGPLIDSILGTGTCELTPLEDSLVAHRVFLESMVAAWNTDHACSDAFVRIT